MRKFLRSFGSALAVMLIFSFFVFVACEAKFEDTQEPAPPAEPAPAPSPAEQPAAAPTPPPPAAQPSRFSLTYEDVALAPGTDGNYSLTCYRSDPLCVIKAVLSNGQAPSDFKVENVAGCVNDSCRVLTPPPPDYSYRFKTDSNYTASIKFTFKDGDYVESKTLNVTIKPGFDIRLIQAIDDTDLTPTTSDPLKLPFDGGSLVGNKQQITAKIVKEQLSPDIDIFINKNGCSSSVICSSYATDPASASPNKKDFKIVSVAYKSSGTSVEIIFVAKDAFGYTAQRNVVYYKQ